MNEAEVREYCKKVVFPFMTTYRFYVFVHKDDGVSFSLSA